MTPLPLKATDRPLLAGDLNACVAGDVLEVPRRVTEIVGDQNIKTARQLLSYGQAFPTTFVTMFGWTPEQVSDAMTRLAEQIGAASPKRRMVAFGARNPEDLENR